MKPVMRHTITLPIDLGEGVNGIYETNLIDSPPGAEWLLAQSCGRWSARFHTRIGEDGCECYSWVIEFERQHVAAMYLLLFHPTTGIA